MGFRISLEANKVYLKPVVGHDPAADPRPVGDTRPPPAGSFPVVTSVALRLRSDGQGPDPIGKTDSKPASITFFGRIKSKTAAAFTPLGVLAGVVDFDTSGKKPLQRFTVNVIQVKDPPVPGAAAASTHPELAFTPDTADVVRRSDWVIEVVAGSDGSMVIPSNSGTLFLTLPWLFDIGQPSLELSASLSVDGAVVASETKNTPLQLPLEHKGIAEDLDATQAVVSMFGVRTLAPASLERPGAAIGGNAVNVFLDTSFTTFVATESSGTAIAAIAANLQTILSDIGFASVKVVATGDAAFAAQKARFDANFTNTNGRFHASNLTNVSAPSTKTSSTKTFLADGFLVDGEGALLPFFDYFVVLEGRTMTKPELGNGELFAHAGATPIPAGQKLEGAPIVIAGGSNSSTGVRGELAKVDPRDHANLFANVIAHEVFHGMGLKHVVTFIDTPPYKDTDPQHFTDSIMYMSALNQPPPGASTAKPRVRLNFAGPVQRQALRSAFSIP